MAETILVFQKIGHCTNSGDLFYGWNFTKKETEALDERMSDGGWAFILQLRHYSVLAWIRKLRVDTEIVVFVQMDVTLACRP